MPLAPGSKIGGYEIVAPLGAGGMGEVYRARDSRLKRDVAVKVLPEAFAGDAERMARFQREAELLAALNHPHIAHIYGIEDRAIVMELVDGESPKGPMPFEDAWKIAAQIADALEYAHERGIIHRDLKPANVKITPDGIVKLLDFGLAKAFTSERPNSETLGNSPTLTLGATQLGVILGTAAYMAPEQAKGKTVDKRADIWSWAVVFYELLTGDRLFESEDIPDTLAQVLTRQPDLQRVPAHVRKLLQRCLEKDPKQRLRDIGEARFWLDREPAPVEMASRRSRLTISLVAIACVLLLGLGIVSFVHFREPRPERTSVRFQIPVGGQTYVPSAPVLSPDGRSVTFVLVGADGISRLWIRALDSLEMRALPGTEGASPLASPFWSPDGRFIAFFAEAKLKRISASGGPPVTLCNAPAATGGAWSRTSGIVIGQQAHGLSRVWGDGVPAQIPGSTGSPGSVSFLPDGRHIIYSMSASPLLESNITLSTVDGTEGKRLLNGTSLIAYSPPPAPGEHGHLMFLRENTLMAQSFDERALQLVGDSFPVAEQVAWFSVSENGALAYRPVGTGGINQLIWFDRTGKSLGTVGSPGVYNDLVLSPDAKRIAVSAVQNSGNMDISIIDVSRGIPTQITSDPAREWDPVWSPDGSRIAFASQRGGPDQMYLKNSSGIGEEQPLLKSIGRQRPMSWSPDGRFLLYMNAEANSTVYNLYVLPVVSEHPKEENNATPYFSSSFNITQGQFSPGPANSKRWIAYTSNEDVESQIYVQSFPVGAQRIRASRNGGVQPRWRPDGKELYYISLDRKLMAVDIKTSPNLEVGVPKELFQTSMTAGGGFTYVFRYDVAPDGRFLVLSARGNENPAAPPINIWLNWTAGLKR